jgi:hypothetical protein
MVRFIHVNEGADGMWAAARQGTRHIVRRPWYEGVRAIAVVEQIVLTDDLGDICVLGHHPERIKAFGFDPTERSVRAKPPKPGKQRFLVRISFRRGDQASEALGYFFNLRHLASISHVRLWSQAGFYHTLPPYVKAREMNHAKGPLESFSNTLAGKMPRDVDMAAILE